MPGWLGRLEGSAGAPGPFPASLLCHASDQRDIEQSVVPQPALPCLLIPGLASQLHWLPQVQAGAARQLWPERGGDPGAGRPGAEPGRGAQEAGAIPVRAQGQGQHLRVCCRGSGVGLSALDGRCLSRAVDLRGGWLLIAARPGRWADSCSCCCLLLSLPGHESSGAAAADGEDSCLVLAAWHPASAYTTGSTSC